MTIDYKYLTLAFMQFCGDKHGATFADEDIDTLHVDGKPASKTLIEEIKALAQKLSDEAAPTVG
jgi:hypothetical protein